MICCWEVTACFSFAGSFWLACKRRGNLACCAYPFIALVHLAASVAFSGGNTFESESTCTLDVMDLDWHQQLNFSCRDMLWTSQRERERQMSIDTVSHVHQRTLPGKSKGPSKASRGSSGSLSLVIDVASLFSCSMLVVELCNHQSSHQYLPGRGRRKATSQSEGESSWPCQGRGALRSLDRFGWFVLHQTI